MDQDIENQLPLKNVRNMKGHRGSINSIKFNAKGTYCMTCGQDKTVRLWNPHKSDIHEKENNLINIGNCLLIKSYSGIHGYDVQDIAISHDNGKFSSCGSDKMVILWDVSTGNIIRKFQGHEHVINALEYNMDSNVLFSASYDKTVRIWDIRDRMSHLPIQVLNQFNDSVTSLAITEYEIITGSVDGKIRTFDLRKGIINIDNLFEPIVSVSISSDNNCILAGCVDGTLRLIEKETGTQLNCYKGLPTSTYRIKSCFTNEEAHVLSGSEDGMIYIWDFVDSNIVHKLKGHQASVLSIAYHAEECLLVSASVDGQAKVWSS